VGGMSPFDRKSRRKLMTSSVKTRPLGYAAGFEGLYAADRGVTGAIDMKQFAVASHAASSPDTDVSLTCLTSFEVDV
jgi:hypothetical protein